MKYSKVKLFIVSIFLVTHSFGQIPELKILSLSSVEKFNSDAKTNFFHSNYFLSESQYFEKLEKEGLSHRDFLYFANALAANNKVNLAMEFYNEYYIKTNNHTNDISSLFSDDKYSFIQSDDKKKLLTVNPTIKGYNLYIPTEEGFTYSQWDCDGTLSRSKLIIDIPAGSVAGSASFFDDNRKAVVSIIDYAQNSSSLYYYYMSNGKWKKPVKLFNKSGQYAFPYIDEENKTLYFSSNIQGGYGGYDIYVSTFNGESFSNPINLGDQINTEMNEINPLLADGWLYLSSNGFVSKGGYDIYKYKNVDGFNHILENCKEWNSSADEIGLLYHSQNQVKIIRQDINSAEIVSLKTVIFKSTFSGSIINKYNKPMEDVLILCLDNNTFTTSDIQGNYTFRFERDYSSINIRVLHNSYDAINKQLFNGKPDTSKFILNNTSDRFSKNIKPEKMETNLNILFTQYPDEYFIVLGSSNNYEHAYEFWSKWNLEFGRSEILEFENGLYRIVIKSGKSEENALKDYAQARKKKSDIWILRPQ